MSSSHETYKENNHSIEPNDTLGKTNTSQQSNVRRISDAERHAHADAQMKNPHAGRAHFSLSFIDACSQKPLFPV